MSQVDNDPASNPSAWQRNQGERIGGADGYHRSLFARGNELAKAYADNEFRIDTPHDSLSSLQHRYAKEFAAAEKRMEQRRNSWAETFRLKVKYDYESDPMYKAWSEDKARAKELLHIHPLDEWLDSPMVLMSHACKVTTTLGGLQGAYRGYSLWQNIDQQYAKLNGLTFKSLFIQETSMGILRGAAVGCGMGIGMLVGDSMHRVGTCLIWHGSVARERRKWQGVTAAFTMAGVLGSAVSCVLLREILSLRGMGMFSAALTSLMFSVGLGVGYLVYKPHEEAYKELSYDDPHWRPWNQREFQTAGPVGIRGRYV